MSVKNNISSDSQRKHVIIRNGLRVSDLEYSTKEDAKVEYDHRETILSRWPDGSKLEICELKDK